MDPNATLAKIRQIVEDMNLEPSGTQRFENLAAELLEHVEALDGWLSKGGFMPQAWVPGA